MTEAGDRDGVVVGVGDVLAAVHVDTQLSTLVQAGDVGYRVDNGVSTELTLTLAQESLGSPARAPEAAESRCKKMTPAVRPLMVRRSCVGAGLAVL